MYVLTGMSFLTTPLLPSSSQRPAFASSLRGRTGGVRVVTPSPVSIAVGPPGPVLRVPSLGPVLVGVKVTLKRQLWLTIVGGQLLVWT